MNFKFKKKLSVIAISSVLTLGGLAGCDNSGPINGGTPPPTTAIAGKVTDGPINNGLVTFVDANGAVVNTGAEVRTTTDGTGSYSVDFPESAAVPVTVTITGGTDSVTGEAQSIAISSIMTDAKSPVVNVNPFTTLALEIVKASGGAVTAQSLAAAAIVVKNSVGFGLPADYDIFAAPADKDSAAFLKASEALAETVRRAAGTAGTASVLASLGADLTDGIVDGKAAVGATGTTSATDGAAMQTNLSVVGSQVLSNTLTVTTASGPIPANVALDAALMAVNPASEITSVADVPVTAQILEQTSLALTTAAALNPTNQAEILVLQAEIGKLNVGDTPQLEASFLVSAAPEIAGALDNSADVTKATEANTATTNAASFKLMKNEAKVTDVNGVTTLTSTTVGGVMLVTPTFTLDAANLQKVTGANPTGGTVPTINFDVMAPVTSGAGLLNILLKDGGPDDRKDGEREIKISLPVTWTANNIAFTVPAGNSAVVYTTANGAAELSTQVNNAQANIFTFDNQQQQMQLAITKLFSTIPELDGLIVNGNYSFQVGLTVFPMVDASSAKVNMIKGSFSVQ